MMISGCGLCILLRDWIFFRSIRYIVIYDVRSVRVRYGWIFLILFSFEDFLRIWLLKRKKVYINKLMV